MKDYKTMGIMTKDDEMLMDILDEYEKVYNMIDSNRLDDMLMKAYKREYTDAVEYILDLKKVIDMYCILKDVEYSIIQRIVTEQRRTV